MNDNCSKFFYRPHIQLDCKLTRKLIEDKTFEREPLIIGDVGVRSGFDRLWDVFETQCIQIGFEPDEDECNRIKEKYNENSSENIPRIKLENKALWDIVGKKSLYLTRDPHCASFYHPNDIFLKRLPDSSSNDVIDNIEMEVITLDHYHGTNGIDFDVLKIDVQGGELNVLSGASEQLRTSILAVVAEVAFVELYSGQACFNEVDGFMNGMGFSLFDLDIRRWRRKELPKIYKDLRVGQIIYADALYLKDPIGYNIELDKNDKRIKALKLIALAEYFSLPDYSMEILAYSKAQGLISNTEEIYMTELLLKNQITARRNRNEIEK